MQRSGITFEPIDKHVLKLKIAKSGRNSKRSEGEVMKKRGWTLKGGSSPRIYNKGEKIMEISKIFPSNPDWNEDVEKSSREDWMGFEHKVSRDAKIFGLGEKTGQLDKGGYSYKMWNTDVGGSFPLNKDPLYMSIPFYISKNPGEGKFIGVYVDYPGEMRFDMKYRSGPDKIGVAVNHSEVSFYIIVHGDVEGVLNQYTEITGRPFMPPKWALGYQHSKYGRPKNKEEVLNLADKFRDKKMPCDVIYFDIQYMEDYKVFKWDEERYGDPEKLLGALHDEGFKVVNIIEPGVKAEEGFSIYDEGKDRDAFVKDKNGEYCKGSVYPGLCVFPDFFNPDAREWWAEKNVEMIKMGVNGLWNDMNEPAIFFGQKRLNKLGEDISKGENEAENPGIGFFLRTTGLILDKPEGWVHNYEGKEVSHEKIHNKYGFFEDKSTFKAFEKYDSNIRPFILSRSGFAGVQKYATVWTGDNASSWEDMRQSIPMLLNLGLSGLPFVGPDVGGFSGNVSPELLTRWIQLGTFYPFFRNHSTIGTHSQEPWVFGEPYENINRKYLDFRYRILPYLYTLIHGAHETGKPVMRPLFMEFPEDENSYEIQDEFMLGGSLLVSPVLEKGKEKKHVYLPYKGEKALKWKDWWSGEILESGHHIVTSPLDEIPLFIREGRGVPIFAEKRINSEEVSDELTLKVHLRDKAEVPIYYDDGKTKDFQRGKYFSGKYIVEKRGGKCEIELEVNNQGFNPPWERVNVEI